MHSNLLTVLEDDQLAELRQLPDNGHEIEPVNHFDDLHQIVQPTDPLRPYHHQEREQSKRIVSEQQRQQLMQTGQQKQYPEHDHRVEFCPPLPTPIIDLFPCTEPTHIRVCGEKRAMCYEEGCGIVICENCKVDRPLYIFHNEPAFQLESQLTALMPLCLDCQIESHSAATTDSWCACPSYDKDVTFCEQHLGEHLLGNIISKSRHKAKYQSGLRTDPDGQVRTALQCFCGREIVGGEECFDLIRRCVACSLNMKRPFIGHDTGVIYNAPFAPYRMDNV